MKACKSVIRAIALLGASAWLSGCTSGYVLLQVDKRAASKTPEAWNQVYLAPVEEAGDGLIKYDAKTLSLPPNQALEKVLGERLGQGSRDDSRPVVLLVKNARLIRPKKGSLGLAADFILLRSGKSKLIRLEHSINAPSGDSSAVMSLYTRALYDLTDHLLYHAEAMAFLGGADVTVLGDSAVIDEPVEHGPLLPMAPSSEGLEATGRVMWGTKEKDTYMGVTLMLGDAKGAFANYSETTINKYSTFAYGLGAGGLRMSGETALIMTEMLYAGLGYSGMNRDDDGNVLSPGLTIFAGPQLMGTIMIMSDINMAFIQIGARANLDFPIGQHFGVQLGGFSGYSMASVNVGSVTVNSSAPVPFIPSADLYYQTATGRISLGLTFQALEDIGSLFSNPMITLTWEERAGRGIAYSKSGVAYKDISLFGDADVLSGPQGVFAKNSAPYAPDMTKLPGPKAVSTKDGVPSAPAAPTSAAVPSSPSAEVAPQSTEVAESPPTEKVEKEDDLNTFLNKVAPDIEQEEKYREKLDTTWQKVQRIAIDGSRDHTIRVAVLKKFLGKYPDNNPYKPKAEELLRDLCPGTLVVRTEPPGATVLIDGLEAGKSPLTTNVRIGKLQVKAILEGYIEIEKTVEVTGGEKIEVVYTLEESPPGTLSIETEPPGASVLINGKRAGVAPVEGKVGAETYKVEVKLEGYQPAEKTVTVHSGKKTTTHFILIR
ncbi:MAG TPA: PEGA domain-containing protein [Myxococcota bacterium]|nr:PEGA domain-containing protein [Myxococcota bacterium]